MGLFVDNEASARKAGVFVIEQAPPVVIEGVSNGRIGICLQSEWGPLSTVVEPESGDDLLNIFFPAGSARTSTGYYAMRGRKKGVWSIVRVLGASSAAAAKTITGTGGNTVITAKFHGTTGNSISCAQTDATDGVSTHKKLTFTLTNSVTGTTTEIYDNVSCDDSVALSVDVSQSILLASIVVAGAQTAWPANATASLTGGSDGSAVIASEYDTALTLLDLEDDVRVLVADGVADSILDGVNDFLVAHAVATSDRMTVLQGDPDNTWAEVQTGVATSADTYRNKRVIYSGAWVDISNDAGISVISPFATMIATALVNKEPQESHAWWADEVTDFYAAIQSIHAVFSTASESIQGDATEQGICLPIRLPSGKYAALHDRTTSLTLADRFATTRRIKDFFAKSWKNAMTTNVNGPNIESRQNEIVMASHTFFDEQVQGGRLLKGYSIDVTSANTPTSIGQGKFKVKLNGTNPSVMEKIFLIMNVSPFVVVSDATQ